MKIFRMNDCDWMAGESLEACITAYKKTCEGSGLSDDELLDEPRELTDHEMDRLKFWEGTPDNPKGTFREALAKMEDEDAEFPVFFASAEY